MKTCMIALFVVALYGVVAADDIEEVDDLIVNSPRDLCKCCPQPCCCKCVNVSRGPPGQGGDCDEKLDLVFIVDSSRSILMIDWVKVQQTLIELTNDFDIGPDKVRVALVQFANDAIIHQVLKDTTTHANFVNLINGMTHLAGQTFLNKALALTASQVLIPPAGDRPNVKTVTVILVDGAPSAALGNTIDMVKMKSKVVVWGVNIRENIKSEINDISTDNMTRFFDDFDELLSEANNSDNAFDVAEYVEKDCPPSGKKRHCMCCCPVLFGGSHYGFNGGFGHHGGCCNNGRGNGGNNCNCGN